MTEIKYKDTTIPVEAGQTVTLNTADKKLTGDIEVTAPAESGGGGVELVTINFTNTSTSYSAEMYGGTDGFVMALTLSPNYSSIILVPKGSTFYIAAPRGDAPSGMGAFSFTETSGAIEVLGTGTAGKFKVNGDCTITGYAYDAD